MVALDDPPMSPREAAAYLGISRRSFDRTVKPKLPAPEYPLPRRPKWRRSVIDSFRVGSIPAQAAPPAKGREKKRKAECSEDGFDFDKWFAEVHGAKKRKGV
jgi:hypothetical protein